jgi:hypothetical protein
MATLSNLFGIGSSGGAQFLSDEVKYLDAFSSLPSGWAQENTSTLVDVSWAAGAIQCPRAINYGGITHIGNGDMFIVCGGNTPHSYIYNYKDETWTENPTIPYGSGVAYCGGMITTLQDGRVMVAAGGGTTTPGSAWYVYNPTSQPINFQDPYTWQTLPSCIIGGTTITFSWNGSAITRDDGKVMVVKGGYSGGTNVFIYDPSVTVGSQWSEGPSFSGNFSGSFSRLPDGSIYAIGTNIVMPSGSPNTSFGANNQGSYNTNVVFKLNKTGSTYSNTWQNLMGTYNVNRPIRPLGVAECATLPNGKVLVVTGGLGAQATTTPTSDVLMHDVANNTWSILTSLPPNSSTGAGTTVKGLMAADGYHVVMLQNNNTGTFFEYAPVPVSTRIIRKI